MKLRKLVGQTLCAGVVLAAAVTFAAQPSFESARSVSCTANCTCNGADGSATIPLTLNSDTKDQAAKDAKGQCDQIAAMSGAAPGACNVQDLSCQ